jgi:hypothetical protein
VAEKPHEFIDLSLIPGSLAARRSAEAGNTAGRHRPDLENFAPIVLATFLPEAQTANPGRGGRRGTRAPRRRRRPGLVRLLIAAGRHPIVQVVLFLEDEAASTTIRPSRIGASGDDHCADRDDRDLDRTRLLRACRPPKVAGD